MFVKGIVEHGSGRGKTDFVPTINLMLEDVPSDLDFGIYACKVKSGDDWYMGALHYGPRSSVDDLVTFEVNIFDFDADIYGDEVEVEIKDKVREIVRFESEAELVTAINNDILKIKEVLGYGS